MNYQKIIILDFGSQYTQLIARRIRELNVYSEIYPYNCDIKKLKDKNVKGIILSGGPSSVYAKSAPQLSAKVIDLGLPILGICYGLQMIIKLTGGEIKPAPKKEYGKAKMTVIHKSPLFDGIDKESIVWMSHGDRVTKLSKDFEAIGNTDNSPFAAVHNLKKSFFGLQFHPEVTHTQFGKEILRNFCFNICACNGDWSAESFIHKAIAETKEKIAEDHVILGLSGGVDSSVTAALLHNAIGDRLHCIFVDTGLLRLNERQKVEAVFNKYLKMKITVVDKSGYFINKLKGITDPEQKRKIIGNTFIEVFEEEARKLGDFKYLAQGTLYPDVIESVSFKGPSATIKSHHNVGGLPEKMHFQLIEPLRELFKDEVRDVGKKLGLPDKLVGRHPFPGPGLAVRILGEITENKISLLQLADDIYISELRENGLYDQIWQAFAVLLPVHSVGVMGDERTYENALVLRAVTSNDGMTANWFDMPYDILGKISSRIINEVKGINRVVYDISSKPPATIEWE